MSTPETQAGAEAAEPGPAAAPPSGALVLAEPVLARQNRMRLSLVWIVPIVALVIGAVLVVRSMLQVGPEIEIEFRSAEGLEPGRTEVRFKEVVIGRVKRVRLGADRSKVLVSVGLVKSMEELAVEDTRFWVVRPRIGTGGISGLGTLFSGVYIGVDAGASTEYRSSFVGLDSPPLVLRGEPGRSFVLRADDLGSLDVGSPVYHRHLRVGRVVGYALEPGGKSLQIQVFIEAPNESLVTDRSRFWNASGVDVSLNAGGLNINAQSLAAVLAGGLAFANPEIDTAAPAAASGHRFTLFPSERVAMASEDGEPLRVRMVFRESLRGLEVGAPVDLLGVSLGTVRRFALLADARGGALPVEVVADLYPQRLGPLRQQLRGTGTSAAGAADKTADDRLLLKALVTRGLRAQLRTGSLLTGQLYVALDFVPKAPAAVFEAQAALPTLPTVPGALADVQTQIAEVAARLARVRFDEIGNELQETLKTLNRSGGSLQEALGSANTMIKQLTPEAQRALVGVQQTLSSAQQALNTAQQTLRSAETNLADPQAPVQRNTAQALAEMHRAATALRVLADYLQRHPESLLRGKAPDPAETQR